MYTPAGKKKKPGIILPERVREAIVPSYVKFFHIWLAWGSEAP